MAEGGIFIIILAAELRARAEGGGSVSYFPFSFIFFFYNKLLFIPDNYSDKEKILKLRRLIHW